MTKKMNVSLIKVVNILSDGEYHDGNTMGAALRMTRSAIWKTIKKLESYDINIDSIKGKGYALLEPLILLEAGKIKKTFASEKIDINIFESIDSTNNYLISQCNKSGLKICLAEQQTHGKGRLNRTWYSPFGKNVYLSCLYSFQKDISELAGLSLVTSLAIITTLKSYGIHQNLFVKWPNDILYENKKLSGGLVEIKAESHGHSHAVIGIGINVNMLSDEHHISQAWTSLRKILGIYIDRNDLCGRLIANLLAYLREFEKQGFSYFVDEWKKTDCLANQMITLKNVNAKIKGKVAGINEQGHLLLQLTNGSIRAFSSGDTSVVKK